jgi:hypothetical protein
MRTLTHSAMLRTDRTFFLMTTPQRREFKVVFVSRGGYHEAGLTSGLGVAVGGSKSPFGGSAAAPCRRKGSGTARRGVAGGPAPRGVYVPAPRGVYVPRAIPAQPRAAPRSFPWRELLREKVGFYFKRMGFFGACPTDVGGDKTPFHA